MPADVGVDTNVVLASVRALEPQRAQAADALARLRSRGHGLVIVPHVCRGVLVGLHPPLHLAWWPGHPGREGRRHGERLGASVRPVARPPRSLHPLESLVTRYAVVGRGVHDARLVAATIARGVPRLLTFDAGDSARYAEIEALDPATVA